MPDRSDTIAAGSPRDQVRYCVSPRIRSGAVANNAIPNAAAPTNEFAAGPAPPATSLVLKYVDDSYRVEASGLQEWIASWGIPGLDQNNLSQSDHRTARLR
jgi:hypothetical protein